MEENQEQIKSLFIRLAEGEATPGERARLLEYLRHNPQPEAIPSVEELPEGDGWPQMPGWAAEAVITSILHQAPVERTLPLWKRGWVKIAAAALPVIGVTALALFYPREPALKRYANDTKNVQTIRLADGSEVNLNQRARLSVSTKGGREVWLEGEAFFSIRQDASQPFTVHAADALDVTVLGTAFNVNTQQGKTQVVLNSGRVKVEKDGAHMVLSPGEMADYDAVSGKLLRQRADTLLHTSWKYDLIPFKARPLKEVMEQLKEQYGYEAVFDHADAENLVFTGYLASNNLPQALTTLEQTFTLKITLRNNQLHVNK